MKSKFDPKKFLASAMILIVLTSASLFAGCGSEYKHLSQKEALEIMRSEKDYVILDVRRQDEYDKKHIKGAMLLPIEELKRGNFAAKLPNKDQTILVYCWTGRRAEDSAAILSNAGYTNVYDFGGLVDWTGETEGEDFD